MCHILDSLINEKQRKAIYAPIEIARTLPCQAFTSEQFFQLEVEQLFSKQWTALCFSAQVKNKGDIYVTEFANMPLFVVRDNNNQCKVFHNIVPYDGCLAVLNSKQAQTDIQTPYHGWRYDLNGTLLNTPYWDGSDAHYLASFTQQEGNLVAVECRVELGIVFINLSGTAASFATHMRPLRKILKDYRVDAIQIGCDADNKALINKEKLATNWKTHYENWALNVLHEAFTHDIYAESSQIPRVNANKEKTYTEHIDGCLMALSYYEEDFAETYDLNEEYTQTETQTDIQDETYSHLGKHPEQIPEQAFIGSFFPNVHIAVFAYFIHIIIVHPISAGKTQTLRAQFYEPNTANSPDDLEQRLEVMDEFIMAGQEDGRITEAVQKARRSPVCQSQFYSPFWDNMHYTFSKQVLSTLEKNT